MARSLGKRKPCSVRKGLGRGDEVAVGIRGGQMLKGRNPYGGEVGCTGRPALLGREVPVRAARNLSGQE